MLKIKDNIDLEKVLTKYGFEHIVGNNKMFHYIKWDYWKYNNEHEDCVIDTKYKRELLLYGSNEYENNIDFLYNMIIDGIIEKVDE